MFAFALASVLATAPLQFEVISGEVPNLVYALDCLSGVVPSCSRAAYEKVWNEQFLKTDADRGMLASWLKLHRKYNGSVEFAHPTPLPLGQRAMYSVGARLRLAGLLANSVENFVARVDVLTLPEDRAALSAVVRHFEPRFRAWWAPRSRTGQAFVLELKRLLGQPEVVALFSAFREFYSAKVPTDLPLRFVVLDRPEGGGATFGEQIDGVSLLEVLPGQHANTRLDVAIHELCHFFFYTTPPEVMSAVQRRFLDSKVPGAVAGYRLFDEAVATALGNGLAQRLVNRPEFDQRLARARGFYNDADLDRAAKALLPWVETRVTEGRGLADATFVDGYLDVLQHEFGAELTAPRLAFFDLLLFEDEALDVDVGDVLGHRLHLSHVSSERGRLDEPEIAGWVANGVGAPLFVLKPEHVAGLVSLGILNADEAKQLGSVKGGALYVHAREGREPVTVIVARQVDDVVKAVELLAGAKAQVNGLTSL